jgi:DMSO/TMAO reductase YedYZ heme-binding membrane subunit
MFPAITTLPLMYEALGGERWQRAQRMGYWAIAMVAGHTLTMGYAGWLTPSTWHGGMPPITLWGFLLAVSALLAKWMSGKSARPA